MLANDFNAVSALEMGHQCSAAEVRIQHVDFIQHGDLLMDWIPLSDSRATQALNPGTCLLRLAFFFAWFRANSRPVPGDHSHHLALGPKFGVRLSLRRNTIKCLLVFSQGRGKIHLT